MILAGIDIGTNTLRLLVAETGPNSFHEIYADRKITRLGQDLDLYGMLTGEAQDRALKALADFAEKIQLYSALQTAAIGTSAVRNASNSAAFIHAVKEKTGIDVTVISGDEEARLTLLGVAHSLTGDGRQVKIDPLTSSLIIDIGGGSTEIITTRLGETPVSVSLPLGAVYLTERYVKHDPPIYEEVVLLKLMVRDTLDRYSAMIQPDLTGMLVGTAGTITTLAAIDQGLEGYDSAKINRSALTRDSIDKIVDTLSMSSLAERRKIRGLEPGREDIILAGAVILQEIMHRFGYNSMLVSDWGLREGIVLDMYEKITKQDTIKATNP
jgi:exopolyphosphatase/guanosine-5'-triphosphate,3'-diphosphate pyrophosphatase